MAADFGESIVTVLFTDIRGSVALGERDGDEATRTVLRTHDELIRQYVAEHGGREVKHLGDGFMICFPSTRRGLACAVQIQKAIERKRMTSAAGFPLVRMGLNAGEVLSEDDDLFGSAVSAAARIMETADGGEIVVSEVVRTLAGTVPGMDFQDRGLVTLKGFAQPCRLFGVEWERDHRAHPTDRTPFIGRAEERGQLRASLERLQRSEGSVLLVGGEPGVGKTRLVEEMLAEAEARDFRTLTGRCYEMDAPPPFLPFIELLEQAMKEVDAETFRLALGDVAGEIAKVLPQLAQLFDDLPAPLELPPEQERRYLFNSIQEFVHRAAAIRPLVVLLDDIHWADETSLQLLEHIAGGIAKVPVLLIGTYRDTDLDATRPVARTLETLIRRRVAARLHLRRLEPDSIRSMLESLAGSPPPSSVVEAIYSETEGNAFFVEEVFRHLSEEGSLFDGNGDWRDLEIDELAVPESVRLVVGRRLERLQEGTRRVLKIAAVVGRVFTFEVVEGASDLTAEEVLDGIDEAEAAKLLTQVGRDGSYSFAHELIRQTLLTTLSLPRRQRMHLQIGLAMENLSSADPSHYARLAHHFFQSGSAADPSTVRRYLRLAGDSAMDSAAFEEALRFYDEALEMCDDMEQSDRAALLYGSGTALRSMGRRADSMARWRDALDIYEGQGETERIAQLATDLAFQMGWAGQWSDTFEMVARGMLLMPPEPSSMRCRLLAIGGLSLSWAGAHDQAITMLDECMAIAEHLGSDFDRAQALGALGSHEFAWMQSADAVEHSREASSIFGDLGFLWWQADALSFELFASIQRGDFDGARRGLDILEPLGHRLGHVGAMMFCLRGDALLSFFSDGDAAAGLKRAQADLELCERYEMPWVAQSKVFLGHYSCLLGDLEAGFRYLAEASEMEPVGALWGWALGESLFQRALLGHHDEARALIAKARPELPDIRQPNMLGIWQLSAYVAEAACLIGDLDTVERVRPILERLIENQRDAGPSRWDGRSFVTISAMASQVLGDGNTARARYEEALGQEHERPNVLESNDVRRLYGQMLLGSDVVSDRERGRQLVSEALAGYRKLGLPWHIAEAERVLAGAG